jgi:drug/metabolite transporter (DMT)-like permease
VLHFWLEPSVVPSLKSAGAAIVIGIVPTAIANVAWDEGFRQGDSQLLTVLAYATPFCSALLLAALGVETLSWRLVAGATAIVIAGGLARADAATHS